MKKPKYMLIWENEVAVQARSILESNSTSDLDRKKWLIKAGILTKSSKLTKRYQ